MRGDFDLFAVGCSLFADLGWSNKIRDGWEVGL